jgi:cytochrome oxidase assembly protein ShyY1
MYRFLVRPKWVAFHLLVILLVVLMVNLAFWQLRRLDHRQQFNSEVRARTAQQTAPFSDVVPAAAEPNDVEWRTVSARGTYLTAAQVIVINRSQAGAAGVDVVTPLQLADGRLLLVNRGFVAETQTVPTPPTGSVEVVGRVRKSEKRTFGQTSDQPDGVLTEFQRIDVDRIAKQLPNPAAQVYVDLITSTPTQGALPVPVPDPDLSEGPHLSYAIQWFIFSICAIVGWVLAVRRSAQQHQRQRLAAAALVTATASEVPAPSD